MKRIIFNDKIEEEYHSLFNFVGNDPSWTKKIVDDFYTNNRRISFKFCWPMLNANRLVYYCCLEQLPAKWLSSCIVEEYEGKIFPQIQKYRDANKFDITKFYNSKRHAAESCYRHLLRLEFEKYLGNCFYSLTHYENLLRISIPHEDRFLILLNAYPEFDDYYKDILNKSYKRFGEREARILDLCEKKLDDITDISPTPAGKLARKDILWDFYKGKEDVFSKELRNEFISCFKEENEDGSVKFVNEDILYAAIGTLDGIPLARYEKDISKRKLVSYDEFKFFLHSASIQQLRQNIEKIFGKVKHTITVYEKLIELTFPISNKRDYLLVLAFENKKGVESNNEKADAKKNVDKKKTKGEKEEETRNPFFPDPMKNILKFIEDRDWSEITINV